MSIWAAYIMTIKINGFYTYWYVHNERIIYIKINLYLHRIGKSLGSHPYIAAITEYTHFLAFGKFSD